MMYYKSETKLTDEQVKALVDAGLANAWKHPKSGKERYYINKYGLGQIIDLEVDYFKSSGRVCYCAFVNENGEKIITANRRGYYGQKIYIEDGTVYSGWTMVGEEMPETIALRAIQFVEK